MQCKKQIQEALRSIEREHQRDALLCIWSNVFPVLRIVIVIRQKRPHMATLVAFRASCNSKRSITGGRGKGDTYVYKHGQIINTNKLQTYKIAKLAGMQYVCNMPKHVLYM